ncbi:hypothetical protein Tco_0827033 [Tanacetum coccineum]
MKTAGFGAYWADNLRVIASKAELAKYWVMISSSGDFLRAAPSYILIREPLRRLCHRLIAFTIAGRICFGEEAGSSDVWRSLYYMTRYAFWGDYGAEPPEFDCGGPRVGAASRAAQIDPEAPKDAVMGQVDVQHDPTPQHGPQMPQATALAPKTIPQRL